MDKGNLVLTGGLANTMQQLLATSSTIKTCLLGFFGNSFPPTFSPQIWANVKWFKVLINSVPTGVTGDWGAKTLDKCHAALALENPAYASLQIMQKPSWVCPPISYTIGSASSLIVAFKDPDGSKSRALLTSCQLFLFGARAKVTCWKKIAPKLAHPTFMTLIDDTIDAILCCSGLDLDTSMVEDLGPLNAAAKNPTDKRKAPVSPPQPTNPSSSRAPKGKKAKRT